MVSKLAIIILLVAVAAGVYFTCCSSPAKPPEMKDGWFGAGKDKKPDDPTIHKFRVNVSDSVLKDLKSRLEKSRLTQDLEESTFEYGFQSDILRNTIMYWRDTYNWRRQEEEINKFNHFKTQIEGLMIHYVHVKSKHKNAKPLILIHGWPGSVWEFYKMIPMLTDPTNHGGTEEDAFEVICPSIPGYGWSEPSHHRGFDQVAAARIFHKLMQRLGHEKYYAQGGDWGSMVATVMAQAYPAHVEGVHLNMFSPPNGGWSTVKQIAAYLAPSVVLGDEAWKMKSFGETFLGLLQETGYFHLQATKPDTVGVGLNDSPAGLAAYILEKFSTWTDPEWRKLADGGLIKKFTMDELLTNIMIYWTTGTIKSSCRFYKELFHGDGFAWDNLPVTVPTGLAGFPNELVNTPRAFAELKYHNIVQFTDMPRGGHFAAFEEPELMAKDIRSFVRAVKNKT